MALFDFLSQSISTNQGGIMPTTTGNDLLSFLEAGPQVGKKPSSLTWGDLANTASKNDRPLPFQSLTQGRNTAQKYNFIGNMNKSDSSDINEIMSLIGLIMGMPGVGGGGAAPIEAAGGAASAFSPMVPFQ